MKLIVIFGPAAVGKMSVGIELSKLIDYKLFHNHVIIDALYDFYSFSDEQLMRLTSEFRKRLFEEFGKSNFNGLIFTYVWALDQDEDKDELFSYISSMNITLEDVFFVELEAEQNIRLERNKSELRLSLKKSKRNIYESETFLRESEKINLLNSNNDFYYPEQHLKINNSYISPTDVAEIIKNELNKRGFT
jgi:hypothetical protein